MFGVLVGSAVAHQCNVSGPVDVARDARPALLAWMPSLIAMLPVIALALKKAV